MAEPRDHILPLGAILATSMTTLANVTAKVRVNGGAPTTYTNGSSPAIVQNADCTYAYLLKIPAGTYADGDTLEVDWLYSGTPVPGAYQTYIIGPAAVDGASFTTALASALAALTSRTGTAQAGASGSITLDSGASGLNDFYVGQWVVIVSGAGAGQSRLITAYNGSTKVATVHNNWKTNPSGTSVFYLLPAADILGVVLADTATTLTNAPPDSAGVGMLLSRLSSGRATLLDNLSNLDGPISGIAAAVWAVGTRTLTAISDSPGVGTLLSRIASALTITGGKVDVNDKTGFALTSAYDPAKTAAQAGDAMALTTGERTTLTASIWNAVTSGFGTAGSVGKLIEDFLDAAISTRLATSGYTAPDNTSVAAIKAKTDLIPAAGPADAAAFTSTRAAKLDHLDVDVGSRLAAGSYVAPDNADIATILTEMGTVLARIPSDILDEVVTSHNVANSLGKLLQFLDAAISTRLSASAYGADSANIAAMLDELVLIKTKTDLLGTGVATVRSAITADGKTIEIVIGGDYYYADGLPFIDLTLPAGYPDLTTATSITVTIDDVLSVSATARSATRLTADLPAAQSSRLKAKHYRWGVDAVFSGHETPIVRGDLIASPALD